ncbi:MAG TPA: hypothetical protein VEH06_04940 [Candidatus Bathyarchaeia archaeon]|nr:hypothetical protein [Candidatus Bathyarchaeia archaeon]
MSGIKRILNSNIESRDVYSSSFSLQTPGTASGIFINYLVLREHRPLLHCMAQQTFTIYTIMFAGLSNLENDKNKICNDGDTLEDFYRHAHLDEP